MQKGSFGRRRKSAFLRTSRAVFGFCLAVAVIAAAIADPLVEFGSNLGWFGPGSLTDHSNLDVFPALLAGIALLALFMLHKARAVLAGRALSRGWATLFPAIFVLQIFTLYVMETIEQLLAFGHVLGPTIWLGAPPTICLAAHAVVCIAVACAIVRSRRTLAGTTLRVVRLIVAILTFVPQITAPISLRRFGNVCFKEFLPVFCTIGERAPPIIVR